MICRGQPERLQGQCYAIPTDHGNGVRNDIEVSAAVGYSGSDGIRLLQENARRIGLSGHEETA